MKGEVEGRGRRRDHRRGEMEMGESSCGGDVSGMGIIQA